MTNREITYLVLSDIHFNHRRTESKHIKESLDIFFDHYTDDSRFKDIDAIFIAGDLLDRIVNAASDDLYIVLEFLNNLIRFCAKFNIILRLMEGTPSHDWKQNRLASIVSLIANTQANVKVIDSLSIEYLSELQLHILYVPDEWSSSTSETLKQVKDLLQDYNLSKVDIAIMHGLADYQMAGIPGNHDTHDLSEYFQIVRHYINMGHHHKFSYYDRFISQGSFDRLSHGEEEAKGAVLMRIRGDKDSFTFLENKNAKKYITIDVTEYNMEALVKKLNKLRDTLAIGSFIRLSGPSGHQALTSLNELQSLFPFFIFSKISKEDQASKEKSIENIFHKSFKQITLTNDNILSALMEEVIKHNPLPLEDTERLETLLNSIR